MTHRPFIPFLLLLSLVITVIGPWPAYGMVKLTDRTISEAVKYGMENRGLPRSTFLGSNWIEGQNGALLNIYTPYMDIARTASKRKFKGSVASPEAVSKTRKAIVQDIDYIYLHPSVKFIVSLYGNSSDFAKKYYAVIEGVGNGRNRTIYPTKSIPQYLADEDKSAAILPYSAINTYHFKYDDIAPLDEFTLKLYGKEIEPVTFRVNNHRIQ